MSDIPIVNSFGGLDEYFLHLLPDGRIIVKDGRSLEEYINDPRLVERRQQAMQQSGDDNPREMLIMSRTLAEIGLIPRIA